MHTTKFQATTQKFESSAIECYSKLSLEFGSGKEPALQKRTIKNYNQPWQTEATVPFVTVRTSRNGYKHPNTIWMLVIAQATKVV